MEPCAEPHLEEAPTRVCIGYSRWSPHRAMLSVTGFLLQIALDSRYQLRLSSSLSSTRTILAMEPWFPASTASGFLLRSTVVLTMKAWALWIVDVGWAIGWSIRINVSTTLDATAGRSCSLRARGILPM